MRSWSIRWRMTLWYGMMVALLVIVFGASVFVLTVRRFSTRVDFELAEEMHELQLEVIGEHSRERLLKELQAEFAEHQSYEFEILQEDGSPLFRSQRLHSLPLQVNGPSETWPTELETSEVRLKGLGEYRVMRQAAKSRYGLLLLQVGIPLQPMRDVESELLKAMAWFGPLILVLAVSGGYWLAGRMLAPIQSITETAAEITAQRLKRRIVIPDVDDELSRLAHTLNEMINRLDRAFDDMQRFTADAAHELRTPLAVMRTQLDVALRTERSPDAYRSVLVSLKEDVDRMSSLAAQLLELAREDAGVESSTHERVCLRNVLQEVAQHYQSGTNQRGVTVQLSAGAAAHVHGDKERLRRVFLNVLDNAVKYTPDGGAVSMVLEVSSDRQHVQVVVTDTGSGISPQHLPHVFDRFYRADPARSSPLGTGLGLAICKAIVASHGGTIEVESPASEHVLPDDAKADARSARQPVNGNTRGTSIRIRLPLTAT